MYRFVPTIQIICPFIGFFRHRIRFSTVCKKYKTSDLMELKRKPLPTEREVIVKAPWGNIAVLTWGDSANPPVLFCHGKLDTASSFRPLVSLLPKCFFYVSVDLPGNGRSDHLPRGVLFTVMDLVQTVFWVKNHFKWNKFIFVGHSLGVVIGRHFNLAYPNHITRMVELDPVPAYHVIEPRDLGLWYQLFYDFYYVGKYNKINGDVETAPKYTYEKALDMMMSTRMLNQDAAEHILERTLEPAGNGLFRFTYDQRMKEVPRLPLSHDYLKELYTSGKTPTLCILARFSIDEGWFADTPFVMDDAAWPNKNFEHMIVDGYHDVHIENPGSMAESIDKFLLEDVKAKL